jgi:hypothetical protein
MLISTSPSPASHTQFAALGIVVIGAYLFALGWAVENTSYDIWGAVLLVPVLLALTVPIAKRVAEHETDPTMMKIIMWALVLKLIASVIRYVVMYEVYGSGDAHGYGNWGIRLHEYYRQGIFGIDVGRAGTGTKFLRRLTGVVFAVIGPTRLGGFLVFGWGSFWGLYFMYRAFRIGVPQGDYRRYAMLVFFMPSLLYWPSSIGKEAWMLLTLGLCAYGTARLLNGMAGGYTVLGLGLLGAAMVRPHMSALVCAGLGLAFLMRKSRGTSRGLGLATKVVGGVVILALSSLVLQQVEEFFRIEDEGLSATGDVLDHTSQRTGKGGSEYEVTRVRSPLQLPGAAATVLFRPFPHEAHNMQARIASLEGTALLLLIILSWRRLRAVPLALWRHPYAAFALVYVLLFTVAFSSLGNFGILTRQRAQLLPFFFIFLALPATARRVSPWRARN